MRKRQESIIEIVKILNIICHFHCCSSVVLHPWPTGWYHPVHKTPCRPENLKVGKWQQPTAVPLLSSFSRPGRRLTAWILWSRVLGWVRRAAGSPDGQHKAWSDPDRPYATWLAHAAWRSSPTPFAKQKKTKIAWSTECFITSAVDGATAMTFPWKQTVFGVEQ